MKEHTKNAKQLFILTHNFTLFNQVKRWFSKINDKKGRIAEFYMLCCHLNEDQRFSSLKMLDELLLDYESEYHYLFKLIFENANAKPASLKDYYLLPNASRRLLESFLSFKYPTKQDLSDKINEVDCDISKRSRVIRFVQTHSHKDSIEDTVDNDLSILSETQSVLKDILDLIKLEDEKHYERMKKIVTKSIRKGIH